MYETAASTIRGGLSRGARLLLGSVAGLFGLLMLIMAPSATSPVGFAMFGMLCVAIALACATQGRVRQFLGSVIGSAVFGLAVWYVWSQVTGGPLAVGRRSQPSLVNAVLFFVFFGLPSATYVISARFGFARQP